MPVSFQTSQKVPQTETRVFLQPRRWRWEYRSKTKPLKGPAPEDWIIEAENDLALKKAGFEEAPATLDQMELRALFSGVVIEVNAATDQVFHENDVLFKLIDAKALEVMANVIQEDYPLLERGQSTEVSFDARPDITPRRVANNHSRR